MAHRDEQMEFKLDFNRAGAVKMILDFSMACVVANTGGDRGHTVES